MGRLWEGRGSDAFYFHVPSVQPTLVWSCQFVTCPSDFLCPMFTGHVQRHGAGLPFSEKQVWQPVLKHSSFVTDIHVAKMPEMPDMDEGRCV